MSARQQSNVNHLLIGATANLSTGLAASLNTGEIGIFHPSGQRIVESGASTNEVNATQGMEFYLALGDSSPLQITPVIKGSEIKSIKAVAYAAATQQVDYLGYNGTSGSIQAIDSNLYQVAIYLQDFLRSSNDGRYIKHYQYKSDSSATQAEIAIGLAGSAYFNFSREPKNSSSNAPILFKAICNTALDTNNTMDETVTVTKGSKKISIATDYDYNTGTDLVVGDFIRIADSDATVALTDAVYKIVKITSTSDIELDRPYSGTTGTRTHGNDSTQAITAAQGAAANWGICQTAQAKDHVVGKEHYGVIRWETVMTNFGTTTDNTKSTRAYEGIGVINQLKDLEWFCKGNQGEHYRMGEPTIHSYTSDVAAAVDGGGYDFLSIKVEKSDLVGFQGNVSPIEVTLATPATAPDYMTNTTDGLRDVLEAIAGTGLIAAGGLDV